MKRRSYKPTMKGPNYLEDYTQLQRGGRLHGVSGDNYNLFSFCQKSCQCKQLVQQCLCNRDCEFCYHTESPKLYLNKLPMNEMVSKKIKLSPQCSYEGPLASKSKKIPLCFYQDTQHHTSFYLLEYQKIIYSHDFCSLKTQR